MNADLFKSFLLLVAFFYVSGSGFVVSLLPAKWWRGIWSIISFPLFGVLIHIVFSGILIPRGITIQFSTVLVIVASVLILSIRILKTGFHNFFDWCFPTVVQKNSISRSCSTIRTH